MNLNANFLSEEVPFSVDFVKRLGSNLDLRRNQDLCTSKRLSQAFNVIDPHPCSGEEHGRFSSARMAGNINAPREQARFGLSRTMSIQRWEVVYGYFCLHIFMSIRHPKWGSHYLKILSLCYWFVIPLSRPIAVNLVQCNFDKVMKVRNFTSKKYIYWKLWKYIKSKIIISINIRRWGEHNLYCT